MYDHRYVDYQSTYSHENHWQRYHDQRPRLFRNYERSYDNGGWINSEQHSEPSLADMVRTLELNTLNFQQPNQMWHRSSVDGQNSDERSLEPSLEDLVKSLETNTMQFRQYTQATFKNSEHQMSQMTTSIYQLLAQDSGTLPSQPEINPQNMSVVTLQSEKQLEEIPTLKRSEGDGEQVVEEVERYFEVPNDQIEAGDELVEFEEAEQKNLNKKADTDPLSVSVPGQKIEVKSYESILIISNPLHFSCRVQGAEKEVKEQHVFDVYRMDTMNISLFDPILSIPRYAKLLNEFCTNKKWLSWNGESLMGESILSRWKMPLDVKDYSTPIT